jgi:hypothetical protein
MELSEVEATQDVRQRELHDQVKVVEREVARLRQDELERELARLRLDLPRRWPEIRSLLERVESHQRIRASDWLDIRLERQAYLAFIRFRAVWRRAHEPESGDLSDPR